MYIHNDDSQSSPYAKITVYNSDKNKIDVEIERSYEKEYPRSHTNVISECGTITHNDNVPNNRYAFYTINTTIAHTSAITKTGLSEDSDWRLSVDAMSSASVAFPDKTYKRDETYYYNSGDAIRTVTETNPTSYLSPLSRAASKIAGEIGLFLYSRYRSSIFVADPIDPMEEHILKQKFGLEDPWGARYGEAFSVNVSLDNFSSYFSEDLHEFKTGDNGKQGYKIIVNDGTQFYYGIEDGKLYKIYYQPENRLDKSIGVYYNENGEIIKVQQGLEDITDEFIETHSNTYVPNKTALNNVTISGAGGPLWLKVLNYPGVVFNNETAISALDSAIVKGEINSTESALREVVKRVNIKDASNNIVAICNTAITTICKKAVNLKIIKPWLPPIHTPSNNYNGIIYNKNNKFFVIDLLD